MRKLKTLYILIPLLILASCTSHNWAYLKSELDKAIINGKVFDEQGLPLEGADVVLDEVFNSRTDINGRFIFNYLTFGEHTIKVTKDGYTTMEVTFEHKLKNRKKPLFLRAKLHSYNFLLQEGMFFLQDEKYDELDEILKKLKDIDDKDESYLFLTAAYHSKTGKLDQALELYKHLLKENSRNEYYYLSMIALYHDMERYEDEAKTCVSLGRRNKDFIDYIKKGALIYKNDLEDEETYNTLMDEYNKLLPAEEIDANL